LTGLEAEYVMRALESGWVSSIGEFIDEFEEGFARYCGTKYAVSVSNCTVGLHLVLKSLGIGAGDEVIVPDLSFIATGNAVLMSGARPVFADSDAENLCLSPADLERCLTTRTRAIMPVHLYGHPADMTAIRAFADRHGLAVVEDAAEAHGASIDGRSVGNLGTCGVFSFYGSKNMTTGEGGMITTNDGDLADRCRLLRDHAMSRTKRYWHDELGYNYRMTNLQAAVGCAQLKRASELIDGRRQILGWYREALARDDSISLNRTSSWARPSYWLVCAEFEGIDGEQRSILMQRLRHKGIETRPYFYPMSDMPYMVPAVTPVAHAVSTRGLNLPTYIGLSQSDISTICGVLRSEWDDLRGQGGRDNRLSESPGSLPRRG